MAGPGSSVAIPVWLTEEDLSCIICHGLLTSPVTLHCGHSFCCNCLRKAWGARGTGVAGHLWACPTCREGAAQRPPLRKNTLLQYLADRYSRALSELEAGSAGPESGHGSAAGTQHRPAPPRWNSQKLCLPLHCLIRAARNLGGPLVLLSGSAIQPLTW
uniref:Ring finger protein 135 n=1 Tax=Sciurus vulgaris TaxID=55149 RepID=A0A8D2D8Z5_SCIVU